MAEKKAENSKKLGTGPKFESSRDASQDAERMLDKKYKRLRAFYRLYLGKITDVLAREGLHPNVFSFIILFLSLVFAFFMLSESTRQAGAVAIVIAVCEIMGSLVSEKQAEKKGKIILVDSILDRYSEVIFYTSAMIFALQSQSTITALFVFLSFVGAFMSGFIVTSARQFGFYLDWGLIRRPERIFILAVGMFFGIYGLLAASIVVALASNTAAFYFVWYIWFNKKN
jgi:CDP-diacylglycerol--glycerol-3-phosphate 3-phosphatidyltransferase